MDFAKWISFSLVIIVIYVMWQIKKLILLAFTAFILALTLNIFIKKLTQLGIKRNYGVLISLIFLLCIIVLFILVVVPPLLFQFQELFNLVPQGIEKLIFQLEKAQKNISPEISNLIPNLENLLPQIEPLIRDLLTKGFNLVSGFFGALLSSLLLLALTLMLLVEPLAYKKGLIRFFPSFYRPRVTAIIEKIQGELEEWLTDTFIKIISVIFFTCICLFIFRIRLVLAQALIAGILAFTPYIGPSVSVISPMAIAFLDSQWKPWLILAAYITIYQIVDRIIIPKLRKNRVKLVPANAIIGEVIFANFLGLLGLFLALPLTIISQVIIREILIKDVFDHWKITKSIHNNGKD